MQGKQHVKSNNKRHIKRIVALTCAICFFAIFILFTSLHINSADHEAETIVACQRTQMPECKCENPPPLRISQIVTTHEHNEKHIECQVCAFIHKTISQLRLLVTIIGLSLTNSAFLIPAALFSLLAFAGFKTPIRLKIKNNN